MRNKIKRLLCATSVAALAIAPVAMTTVSISLLSADIAIAKSNGNAGGNGNGNGNGNAGGNGKANANASATRGNSANSNRGGRAAIASTGMRPNELGNMNGALNANMNAVLAHIRNGNTNGPVGQLAALAVADANAEGAAEFLGSAEAQELAALDQALKEAGYDSLDEYEQALAADPANAVPEIEDALADIGMGALDEALADAGYADLGEYEVAVADDPANADPQIDAALAGLGVVDDGSLAQLAEAEQSLQAVEDAELAILDYWNKNGDPDPGTISPEEQELLDALYERLDGNEADIVAAMALTEAAAETEAPTE